MVIFSRQVESVAVSPTATTSRGADTSTDGWLLVAGSVKPPGGSAAVGYAGPHAKPANVESGSPLVSWTFSSRPGWSESVVRSTPSANVLCRNGFALVVWRNCGGAWVVVVVVTCVVWPCGLCSGLPFV